MLSLWTPKTIWSKQRLAREDSPLHFTQYFNVYLKTPEVFLNTVDQHVSPEDVGSHPECGMMIKLTIVESPSSIIDFFKSWKQILNFSLKWSNWSTPYFPNSGYSSWRRPQSLWQGRGHLNLGVLFILLKIKVSHRKYVCFDGGLGLSGRGRDLNLGVLFIFLKIKVWHRKYVCYEILFNVFYTGSSTSRPLSS